jgi:ectoine hydroxylase-related dioxygenase (phytanoyl-CoA dioxygenase family)
MKNDISAIPEFAARGFAVIENVFSAAECDGLLDVLQALPRPAGRAGMRHLMRVPEIAAAARDPRLLAIARETLGPTAIPYKATLFEKNSNANWSIVWHQDTALPLETAFEHSEWGPWSRKDGLAYAHAPAWALARVVALRLHLDAATDDNGPLRIVEGSHQAGVLSDDAVFELARQLPATTCHAGRGGVLAMRPLVVHASAKAKNDAPRRVLHFEYAERLDLAPGIRLALA